MKHAAFLMLVASSSFMSAGPATRAVTPANPIVLQARSLIDVQRGVRVSDVRVVVNGEQIVAMGATRDVPLPEGARTIDLGNATLLPGLVDLHVHLTLRGSPDANARATLQAGFTTVQDLGALNYRNVELRDAIAAGRSSGPRVIASGPWIGRSGGICDFSGIGVRSADAFRRRVQEDVKRGADLIKVCVSGWLQDAVDRPDTYEVGDDELVAAIDEAHRHRRRVAVHALSKAGIRVAVLNGADLIVHGGFPDADTVRAMQKRGVHQLPTLHSLAQGNARPAVDALVEHMNTSVRLGLPLAFGTDAGVIPHGQNAEEFVALTRIGLTPAAALRTATVSAAEVLGLDKSIGTIDVGKLADVIAVDGNPLDDVSALTRVVFVMRGGQVYHNTIDALPARKVSDALSFPAAQTNALAITGVTVVDTMTGQTRANMTVVSWVQESSPQGRFWTMRRRGGRFGCACAPQEHVAHVGPVALTLASVAYAQTAAAPRTMNAAR